MTQKQTLPTGWIWAKLGDFSEIIGGSTPSKDEARYFGGDIIWLTPTEISKETVSTVSSSKRTLTEEGYKASGVRWVPPGSVLLTSRASIGYTAIAGTSLTTNQGFASFILHNSIDPRYIAWWLKSQKEHLELLASGTTFKEISKTTLKDIEAPLAPYTEQQRIVEAIERYFSLLDAVVAELRQKQQQLKRYWAAVLKAAVDGSLTAQWRSQQSDIEPASLLLERILVERRARWEDSLRAKGRDPEKELYPAPAAPDPTATANLPTLPQGWCWATVEQLAAAEPNSLTDGPFGSNLKTEHYRSEGMRVIRLQNIGDGEFKDEKAFIEKAHFVRLSKYRIFSDDLVIAALGDNPPRSCIIPDFVGPAIVKADCIRFKVSPHIMNTYVNIVLNAEPTRKRTKAFLHGIGRPRLNLSEIKRILIVLPPLTEQEQIVAEVEKHLSIIHNLQGVVHANLRCARQLRQVVLREAFAGRLAPQDPEDEPASVLLERIQEERWKQREETREVREVRSTYPALASDKSEPMESGMIQGLLWGNLPSEQ